MSMQPTFTKLSLAAGRNVFILEDVLTPQVWHLHVHLARTYGSVSTTTPDMHASSALF